MTDDTIRTAMEAHDAEQQKPQRKRPDRPNKVKASRAVALLLGPIRQLALRRALVNGMPHAGTATKVEGSHRTASVRQKLGLFCLHLT